MFIRTKILATVGPASCDTDKIEKLVNAGCDLFRVNFSHGTYDEHGVVIDNIRAVEKNLSTPLAILADLCGPKIRVGTIAGGSVTLEPGSHLIIQRDPIEGTAERISSTFPPIVDEARQGECILLDDGKLRLSVIDISPPDGIVCEVVTGGKLSGAKGINLPQTDLSVSALTDKDRADVDWIVTRDIDYVALSFVRSAEDIQLLRALLEQKGCGAHIVAKIEKPQALEAIESIMNATDGVMVARGDLGVEMDLPSVPVSQKRIARMAQATGKSCIIATQMLETMTSNPTPTRAEVSDVANAVLDRTDAVMLSGETAVGLYPVETVTMMNDILEKVQLYHEQTHSPSKVTWTRARTEAALAAAVREIITSVDIAAVAVFTSSGTTARILSKYRLPCPIIGISQNIAAVRRMCLYYGVESVLAKVPKHTRDVLSAASGFAAQKGIARPGDKLVVVTGRPIGQSGAANTLVVHDIPTDVRDVSYSSYGGPS